jgi:hypothetical protein
MTGWSETSLPSRLTGMAPIRKARRGRRAAGALWFMLFVAACWIVYLIATDYGNCRADGSEKVGCFFLALLAGCFEALAFVLGTIVKLLRLVLP